VASPKRLPPSLHIELPPPQAEPQGRPLVRTALLVGLVFSIGMVGFYVIGRPEAELVDAFYMTSITLTTIGYGEVIPVETTAAKLFTGVYAVIGFGMFVYLFSNITAFMVEGGLDRYLWERKMHRAIEKLKDHTVVCGAGNTGRHVIGELLETRRPFVVIDRDPEVVRALHQQLGVPFPAVIGDATDDDVLRAAGVPRASGLIACLSRDNDNLVVTLSARLLAPKLRIVARCIDEREQAKIRRAGADTVVSPNMIGGIRDGLGDDPSDRRHLPRPDAARPGAAPAGRGGGRARGLAAGRQHRRSAPRAQDQGPPGRRPPRRRRQLALQPRRGRAHARGHDDRVHGEPGGPRGARAAGRVTRGRCPGRWSPGRLLAGRAWGMVRAP